MNLKRLIFFFNLMLAFAFTSFSQTDIDPDAEFIYNGNHYVPNSPWATVGMGYSYNISEKDFEPNLLVDVHLKLKKPQYLGVGYMTSRQHFFYNIDTLQFSHHWNKESVSSLHVMYGIRHENLNKNFAAFLGPAINWGYDYLPNDSINNMHRSYVEPGIYATLQYSHKIFYDIGVGTTLFANVCKSSQVVGISLHIYLSTAFKRVVY
jgi:hypothetical protein